MAGTAAEFVLALSPFAGELRSHIPGLIVSNVGFHRVCNNTCDLIVPVNLPSGALLIGIELEAFDNTMAGEVIGTLLKCPVGNPFCILLAQALTGTADVPGATQVRANSPSTHTVDNGANTYIINVTLTGGTDATRLIGLRVFYRLQVSPAPAVASFGDVPTSHPFFPYIEALKASGITGGCQAAPPLFCPDAPLTRGQMATFLSIALGLHFAP